MSEGFDQILEAVHQNVADGKLYEALMQYKSLFLRFSRRSLPRALDVLKDASVRLSCQTDKTAFFGLVQFYNTHLETKKIPLDEATLAPFSTLLPLDRTPEKTTLLNELTYVRSSTLPLAQQLNEELGHCLAATGNHLKAVNFFINNIDLVKDLFIDASKTQSVPLELFYATTILKLLVSSTPTNGRLLYQLVESNFTSVLETPLGHFAVVMTILCMKLLNEPALKNEASPTFDKIEKHYHALLEKEHLLTLLQSVKSKYLPQQHQAGGFAEMMQSMFKPK